MSQESAEEPEKKFFEKFKKAADAQDLEAVFVMVKEVDDFFQVSGWKSSHAFAVREFVRQNLREVLLCWYEKIRELYSCNPPEYDKIVELHRRLLVAYPSAEKAKSLVGYLSNYRVFQRRQKQGDILLMLAKAYFLKEDREPAKAKDFLAVLLSDKYGVPNDIVAEAALVRVDVYLAEGFKEEVLIFLKQRIERYEKEERLELACTLKKRLKTISPDSPPDEEEKPKPLADNMFRKEGEDWKVRYEGETKPLRDAKGLSYIHYLLSNPYKEFSVIELLETVEQQQIIPALKSNAGEVADKQAITEYKKELVGLRQELEKAKKACKPGEQERLQKAIRDITSQLSKVVGMNGQPRKNGTVIEKIRKSVSNSIRRRLERIREVHPALWKHLDSSIHTGKVCWYKPDKLPSWEL